MRATLLLAAIALCLAACSDPEKERVKQTTKATYDQKTGKLTELTYDRNKNGTIDTWTEMDGSRPVRSRSDLDEDGKLDRWEYYENDVLARAEEDGNADGKPDKWEPYEGGAVKTASMDENFDGRPDRRLTYSGGALVLIESEPDASGAFRKSVQVK